MNTTELLKVFNDIQSGKGTDSKAFWRLHNLNPQLFFRISEAVECSPHACSYHPTLEADLKTASRLLTSSTI